MSMKRERGRETKRHAYRERHRDMFLRESETQRHVYRERGRERERERIITEQ